MNTYKKMIASRRQKQAKINEKVKEAMRGLPSHVAKITFDLDHSTEHTFDNDKNAYIKAMQLVADLVDSFSLPSRPRFSLCGMIKNATANDGTVTDGVVRINAVVTTLLGHKASIDIPVIIKSKGLIEPAVFFYDGSPYVMCKPALDQLIKCGSLQKDTNLRRMYSPPSDIVSSNVPRQPIINHSHMFSPGSSNPWKFRRHSQKDESVFEKIDEIISPMTPKKTLEVGPSGKWEPMSDKSGGQEQCFCGKRWCRECSQSEESITCPKCDGSGLAPAPSYEDREFKCDYCGGNGMVFIEDEDIQREAQKKDKVQRERTNIDTPTEMPELWGEYTEDQILDPAERCRHDFMAVGADVSLKEDFEVRERGGAPLVIPKGEDGKIVKDIKGDGMCMVVHFPVMQVDAVVPVKFLKSAQRIKRKAQTGGGNKFDFTEWQQKQIPTGDPKTSNQLAKMLQDNNYHATYDDNGNPYLCDASFNEIEEPNWVASVVHTAHASFPEETGGEGIMVTAQHNAGAAVYHHDDGTWEPVDWAPIYGGIPSTMEDKKAQTSTHIAIGRLLDPPDTGESAECEHCDNNGKCECGTEKCCLCDGTGFYEPSEPEMEDPSGMGRRYKGPRRGSKTAQRIKEAQTDIKITDIAKVDDEGFLNIFYYSDGTIMYDSDEGGKVAIKDGNTIDSDKYDQIVWDYVGGATERPATEVEVQAFYKYLPEERSEEEVVKKAQFYSEEREKCSWCFESMEESAGVAEGEKICSRCVEWAKQNPDECTPEQLKDLGIQKQAATVDQVKHEIREMMRDGYQTIDIHAAIQKRYPELAEEALSGLK